MHRATQALRLIISTFLFPVCIAHGSARANVFLLVVVQKNVLHTRSVVYYFDYLQKIRRTSPSNEGERRLHTHTHTHTHTRTET